MTRRDSDPSATTQNNVLNDHRRVGKRFIPALADRLTHEIRWIDEILPELLWLALLNHKYGWVRGAELALALAAAAAAESKSRRKIWFASTTAFSNPKAQTKVRIAETLKRNGSLQDIASAIKPLVNLYPKCPLRFLFDEENDLVIENREAAVQTIKDTIESLFDRRGEAETFCQGNAIYIAFVTGKLKVFEGLVLAKFPELQEYPRTELSQQIASAVRATINGFFGEFVHSLGRWWPSYFWNNGLKIGHCYFESEIMP